MLGVALVNVSAAAKSPVKAVPIATPTPAHLSISMGVLNPGSAVRGHSGVDQAGSVRHDITLGP